MDFKEFINSYEYNERWQFMVKQSAKTFEKSKAYLSEAFIQHYESNHGYHDWDLSSIEYVGSLEKRSARPDVRIRLTNTDESIVMTFIHVKSCKISSKYTSKHPLLSYLVDAFEVTQRDCRYCCSISDGPRIFVKSRSFSWKREQH